MRRKQQPNGRVLLIVPASLLGNWQKEAARFTPAMPVEILHGAHASQMSQRFEKSDAFLTVTTYRMAMSVEALEQSVWDCIILDEVQAQGSTRSRCCSSPCAESTPPALWTW